MILRGRSYVLYWSGTELRCSNTPRPVYIRMPAGFQSQANAEFFQQLPVRELMVAACLPRK